MCNHLFRFGDLNAQDSSDLLCCCCAADRAAVDRRLALDDGGCQAVTACVATAAAVCTRQALLYSRNALVYLDGKDFGCECKDQAEQQAHDAQNQHRRNNTHHL